MKVKAVEKLITKLIKSGLFIGLVSSFSFLTACSTTTDPAETFKNETPQQIFQRGEADLRDRSYQEATKRFEALEVQYPYERNTQIAQLHLIYTYYMASDYISSEAAADRYIRAYPTSPYVDYAYYMRGLANYYQNLGVFERLFAVDLATRDLSQIKKSYADFSVIVKNYPNSRYAPAAHQYMVYLRNVIANHTYEVASYYYDRKAYIAAANRANEVVRNFQGAPVVPDALIIMARSYRALHLTQNEKETMSVIEYNYPNRVREASHS